MGQLCFHSSKGQETQEPLPAPASKKADVKNPTVLFETTMGSFEAEIYLDRVPRTASNFIDLVNSGFYNGANVSAA